MVLNVVLTRLPPRGPPARRPKARGDALEVRPFRQALSLAQEDEGLLASDLTSGPRPVSHPDRGPRTCRRPCPGWRRPCRRRWNGDKHVLAVGGDGNTVVSKALFDKAPRQGARSEVSPRLFIDGAKALSKAIRNRTGRCGRRHPALGRSTRAVTHRAPALHASVKKALRRPGTMDDARPSGSRNLARRLRHEEPGVSGSIRGWRRSSPSSACRPAARGPPRCRSPAPSSSRTRHLRQVTRNVFPRWSRRMAHQMDRRRPTGGPENLPRLKAYRQLPPPKTLSRH